MKILLLSITFLALSAPAHALTEQANHYNGVDQRSQYADPDDGEEQLNDVPAGNYQGQSGREQSLLNGDAGRGQTYGFGSYDSGWSYGAQFGGRPGYSSFH